MKKILMYCILALSLAGCADSDKDEKPFAYNPIVAPQNENQLLDVSYGDDPEQIMDLYLPAGRKTDVTKVFILVHGGGWFGGDKSAMNNQVILLRNTFPDYAIANVNYRLATKTSLGFPKQINDLQKVVAFLNANRKEYHIGRQFAMYGVSAGAHLSMLYSYRYNTNNQVKAVCSMVGPADFSDPEYAGNPLFDKGINYLVGEYPRYEDNPGLYNAVSPAKQINIFSPKTLMFYSEDDPLVPNTQCEIIAQKLDNNLVYNEYYIYPGAQHANWNEEQYNDINMKTVNFFKNNFK